MTSKPEAADDSTVSQLSMPPTPIGVFWDIENCSVPRGKSALALVQRIRQKFFNNRKEVEFMCVCDTYKENRSVIEELNNAQVNIVHINATSKNAADDKLRQSLRRFASAYQPPTCVLLLSGDVNFACDLSDIKHRYCLYVILVHPQHVQDALVACAHETFSYEDLVANLPKRALPKAEGQTKLLVTGLPSHKTVSSVKYRLKCLSENCGGKVLNVSDSSAVVAFRDAESTARAKKRMDNEDVFGSKISVDFKGSDPAENIVEDYPNNGGSGDHNQSPKLTLPSNTGPAGIKYSPPNSQTSISSSDGKVLAESKVLDEDCNIAEKNISNDVFPESPGKNCQQKELNSGKSPKQSKQNKKKKKQRNNRKKQNHVLDCEGRSDSTSPVTPEKVRKPRAIKAKQPSPVQSAKYAAPRYNQSPPGPKLAIYPTPTPPGTKSGRFHLYHGSHSDTSLANRFLRELGDEHLGGRSRESSLERVVEVENEGNGSVGPPNHELRGVVDKYSNETKPREVLFLQQQFYQEDQGRHGSGSECHDNDEGWDVRSTTSSSSHHSQPAASWRYASPRPVLDHHLHHSPSFRRTPGASRPNSRCSSTSSGRSSPFPGLDSSGSFFQPIRGGGSPLLSAADLCSTPPDSDIGEPVPGSVQLMVSNLDYNISAREWKKILYTEFQQQQVQVLGVQIQTQPDNTNVGFVRVGSVDEARYAISQFHRKKIGYKRIHVSLVNSDPGCGNSNIKGEVSALLKEVTGHTLPLFKFIEMFEKRYHRNVSVSELYRMKDVVEIEEQGGAGRTVSLVQPIRGSPACSNTSSLEEQHEESLESPVCRVHCKEGSEPYMEAIDSASLPNVQMQLRSFAPQVHTLLQTHDGSLPLMSFPSCYTTEFGNLNIRTDAGVPLEHLITCVPGVKVDITCSGIKKVQWAENRPPTPSDLNRVCNSPSLNQQLSQFSREVVDLLKHSPQCRMAFSKFIPSYHHHFGRQCRVADYGYTKLVELFEAIPHIVQILGGGSRRLVTLSHRAQVKRFTSDMLRVLKSQASKQINVLDLPIVYNKVIGKPFSITDYGVCYIEDILSEVPESTMVVTGVGHEMVIAIPRREQTSEEMERTKQFAVEVVDLLKHSPQCRMPFNKFIPAYHHHFGKQCRVADYGFTKLIELFEAIPGVLQVLEEEDEKILSLTAPELLKVLEEQVTGLLKSCPSHELPVPEFLTAFMRYHGHSIRLSDYGVSSVMELIEKIPNIAKVENRQGRLVITLVDHSYVQRLSRRILLMLMDQPGGSIPVPVLTARYQENFGYSIDIAELAHDLEGFVKVTTLDDSGMVKLCPLQLFARDVRTLLLANQGKLALQHFEAAYEQHFGVGLVPASYGCPSVVALLQAVPHVATIRGKGYRRTVLLSHDFQGTLSEAMSRMEGPTSPPPGTSDIRDGISNTPSNDSGITEYHDHSCVACSDDDEKEMIMVPTRMKSPYDLLGAPVPSAVPSPELLPVAMRQSPVDLLRFDPSPPPDVFSGLSEEEKHAQRTPLCQTPTSDMLQFAAQLLPTEAHVSESGCNTPTPPHIMASGTVYYHQGTPMQPSGYCMGVQPADGRYQVAGSTMFYTGQQQMYSSYMLNGQAIDVQTLEAAAYPPEWPANAPIPCSLMTSANRPSPVSLQTSMPGSPTMATAQTVTYQICIQQPTTDQEENPMMQIVSVQPGGPGISGGPCSMAGGSQMMVDGTVQVLSAGQISEEYSSAAAVQGNMQQYQNCYAGSARVDPTGASDAGNPAGSRASEKDSRSASPSEGSASPSGSPAKGTPRRSRIAARFRIPMSPASESNN